MWTVLRWWYSAQRDVLFHIVHRDQFFEARLNAKVIHSVQFIDLVALNS